MRIKSNNIFAVINVMFASLFIFCPFLLTKGKYGLLIITCFFAAFFLIIGAFGFFQNKKWSSLVNKIAAFYIISSGLIIISLLTFSAAYVKSIYGALGNVYSGVLIMAIIATLNLFFFYPAILLFYLKRYYSSSNIL